MTHFAFLDSPHRKEFSSMGKRIQAGDTPKSAKVAKEEAVGFGERLAGLRKAAGFTQIELAAEFPADCGLLREPGGHATGQPVAGDRRRPGRVDRRAVRRGGRAAGGQARRRFLAIKKLNVAEKRQALQVIDAFIERGQLRHKAESCA